MVLVNVLFSTYCCERNSDLRDNRVHGSSVVEQWAIDTQVLYPLGLNFSKTFKLIGNDIAMHSGKTIYL